METVSIVVPQKKSPVSIYNGDRLRVLGLGQGKCFAAKLHAILVEYENMKGTRTRQAPITATPAAPGGG